MNKRDSKRTFRACVAGIANQAVVVNVTALLFDGGGIPRADGGGHLPRLSHRPHFP